jgi:HSP20 family molecular chaperone IbpA
MDRLFRKCRGPRPHHYESIDNTGFDRVETPSRHAHRPEQERLSEMKSDDTFEVNVDMHEFQPSEIKVKTMGNFVVIEGNHAERHTAHDLFTSLHFVRRCYLLPDDTMNHEVHHHFNSNGILEIEVARDARTELVDTEHAL